MMNNYYGNNGFGVSTMGAQERPVMNQPLTKEEIQKLRYGNKAWSLSVSEEDCLRQMCSHKDPDQGTFSLVDNHDGTCTCSICGERFSMVNDLSDDEVGDVFADANDIFQTAKTNYGAVPTQVGRGFYKLGAFMKKMPEFYHMSQEYRKKWNGLDAVERNRATSDWQRYGMLMNPYAAMQPAGGYGAMAQPQMGMPMAGNYGMVQPQAPVQPMGGMQMGAPMGCMTMAAPMGGMQMGAPMGAAPVMNGAPAAAQTGYNAGMPNPAMPVGPAPQVDRPVGVLEPTPVSPAATTADVKKSFKA